MISVIIPTKNRSEALAKVLPSYLSQSFVLEIVLVDDSTGAMHRINIQKMVQGRSKIFLIQDGNGCGLPAARNKGIRNSRGGYIFFGEDDLELGPGHLETLLSHLGKNGADIIGGRKIWKEEGESNQTALKRAETFKGPVWNAFYLECCPQVSPPTDVPAPLLLSHFLARRAVFAKVLFEEAYQGFRRGFPWREETDFLLRAASAGFKTFFCPHAVSFQAPLSSGGIHEGHTSLTKEYWILRNHFFLLRRHRKFIREALKNRWPLSILWTTYALRRMKGQLRSQLYQMKKKWIPSF